MKTGILPKMENILRTYSDIPETETIPRNIHYGTDFTYEMRVILYSSLNYTEEKAQRTGAASSIDQRWKLLSNVMIEKSTCINKCKQPDIT